MKTAASESEANSDPRAEIEERLHQLADRMDRLDGDTDPDPHAIAGRLAAFESDLLAVFSDACDVDESLAASTGHPVLAEGSRWRDLAVEASAPNAAKGADDLVEHLIEDEAKGWRQGHGIASGEAEEGETPSAPADPQKAFRDLADARAFDLEAMSRRTSKPPLRDDRPLLRKRFLAALREREPTAKERRDWVNGLLDRANVARTSADETEPGRAQACLALVRDDLEWHARNVEEAGTRRARLLYEVRRLGAERQERYLQSALEQRFGEKGLTRWNRFIVFLVLLVLVLLTWELSYWIREPSEKLWPDAWKRASFWIGVVDTAACVAFLWDFFVRLRFARGRPRWFARHFLTDFLPSIPVLAVFRPLRAITALRYVRLVRVFGFLTRGLDSLVRRYGHLLNRNVVLYPTRAEKEQLRREAAGLGARVRRLQTRLNQRWERLLTNALHVDREEIAKARVDGLEEVRARGFEIDPVAFGDARTAREMTADDLLRGLSTLTAEELEANVGQDFIARVARGIRLVSLRPIRWTPFVRKYVPRLAPDMTDAEVVVAGAKSSAHELGRHHKRWFWLADLYGTVTPAQFVDRVGTTMFKASLRPAYRLALFGIAFLIVWWLVNKLDIRSEMLSGILSALERIVAGFLLVLGSIAFGTLLIGWWLRNIAGQATDFFEQSARAQFLDLMEAIKGRHIERDAALFDAHVFAPERVVHGHEDGVGEQIRLIRGVRAWLIEAQPGDGITRGFDPVERTAILYRDSLDGALFVRNDTRTIRQLLGNPALRTMRLLSNRFTTADQRALVKLDLDQSRGFLRGPYVWFSLTCQAMAHGVARLIVDYNRHCLPLDQRRESTPDEQAQFENWILANQVADVPTDQVMYVTTHFTALHFLDDDPARDREIGVRFGEDVRERMQRDRKNLFRRVFGTYPLHSRPRDERVVNLYAIYQSWFAGGATLLVPLRLAGRALRFFGRSFGWLIWCVREIRHPSFEVDQEAVKGADFDTAMRKIWRMRGPVAEAIIKKRTAFDPEYLGLTLPGTEESGLESADAWSDLKFLRCDADMMAQVENAQRRASADLVRLGRLLRDGLEARIRDAIGQGFTRERLRSAAIAYVSDMRGVRSHLSARDLLIEVYDRAARYQVLRWQWWPRPGLYRKFLRYWRAHGTGPRLAQRAAWRATKHNHDGVRDALIAWDEYGDGAASVGEQALVDLVRHPERITDMLVTLRAVQTLSLIDIVNYRDHVYRLGRYEDDADPPPPEFSPRSSPQL
ncbi:MAG: hypothetical protein ACYTGZ_03975 [Planctomycetota bacterium]|jgi:hypothetical protein